MDNLDEQNVNEAEIKEESEKIRNEYFKKAQDVVKNGKQKLEDIVIDLLDEDKDGEISITDVIHKSLKVPGVAINRRKFLKNQFSTYCSPEITEEIIKTSPRKAGVDSKTLEKIVKNVVYFERNICTAASVGLGYVPGGLAVDAATTAADLTQYYVAILRVAQKILYLYGFPEIDLNNTDGLDVDDGTINILVLCLGAMAGVGEANQIIKKIAELFAKGVQKELMKKALTKTLMFKIVKKICNYLTISLTKDLFTKGISNAIKFLGGAIMGGLTFFSFQKCCDNLIAAVKDTYYATGIGDEGNIVDVDAIEMEITEGIDVETIDKE